MVWCAFLLTALWLVVAWHDRRAVATLPELPPLPPGAPRPAVTVVMAVRDGEEQLRDTLPRLLAQQHVDLQLHVVDDRSTDGTAARLAGFAAAAPQLQVTTVRELPPDWLGKSHALQLGAANATTPWLLFVDADGWLSPTATARAIAAAEAHGADHVALLPTHRHTTFAGRACLLAFHLVVQRRVAAINGRVQRSFAGTGAFNLVRTAAYRQIGGHQPLRLEVVDDVWLGGLLHRQGFRTRVWFAPRDLAVDWGRTPSDLLRVVEKNMFAVLRYRTAVALGLGAVSSALLLATFTAPWWAGAAGWAALAAALATGWSGALLARRTGWEAAAGWLVPFSRALLPVALLRSTLCTLRRGGVRWRDTFYPLAQLRRGQVR